MSVRHALEWAAASAALGWLAGRDWRAGIARGERLGDLAHALGLRRRVAEANLALAFPDRTAAERDAILRAHYRELGRIVSEYARLPELARAAERDAVATIGAPEHLDRAAAGGRGAVLLSGHYGNVELLAARIAQRYPVDLVVRPQSNPRAERWISERRRASGLGLISADTGLRAVYEALRANRFVAMLGDQDARRHGVFVPFFGRPASTPVGPARISIATGAPIVTGFAVRHPDGRLHVEVEAPLATPAGDRDEAARALTAAHTARLEDWVRRHPEMWFWLHRRWKTSPPPAS